MTALVICTYAGILHQRCLVLLQVPVSGKSWWPAWQRYKSNRFWDDGACSFWSSCTVIIFGPTDMRWKHDAGHRTHGESSFIVFRANLHQSFSQTVLRKNTHLHFLLYLRGKYLDFHKMFRECLGNLNIFHRDMTENAMFFHFWPPMPCYIRLLCSCIDTISKFPVWTPGANRQSVNLYSAYSKRSLMCLIHFCHQYFAKSMFSADVWKYWDSVLGHKDCLAANSKSTGPTQKSADDRNCSIDSAVRPTSAE